VGQAVQVLGAALILAAFVLAQRHRLTTDSVLYLGLNALGAAILAVVAVVNRDVGFVILEVTWAIVSGVGLVQRVRSGHQSAL
jgi:hypothetical protein